MGTQLPSSGRTPIFVAWKYSFSSLIRKILKLAYYRNYCIDSNQILHSDKDQQITFVGCPNTRITNLRWRTAAILEKIEKSPYLMNGLTDHHEIWYGDAQRPSSPFRTVTFRNFKNPRWRRPPFWKNPTTGSTLFLEKFPPLYCL